MRFGSTFNVVLAAAFFCITHYPAPAEAQREGKVTSRPCPHSCKTAGLADKDCRDWREGNTCFVEDLTKSSISDSRAQLRRERQAASGPGCEDVRRSEVRQPSIKIEDTSRSSGGFFDAGERKIFGAVEGSCLSETGLYEDGRKVEDIPVSTDPTFHRFEFEVEADADSEYEVRAYNIFGERDIVAFGNEARARFSDRYYNDRSYDRRSDSYDYYDEPRRSRDDDYYRR
ncbi:MAG: hypothetical protein J5J00_10910 [Deltaproteobacteria bacterium]|nr:hypothetical protein [Deltaproteobacteria bacterium]